jgi:hypothetical protein
MITARLIRLFSDADGSPPSSPVAAFRFVKNPDDYEAIYGAFERYSGIIFSDVEMLRRYGLWNGFVRYSDGGTGEGKGARFKAQGER